MLSTLLGGAQLLGGGGGIGGAIGGQPGISSSGPAISGGSSFDIVAGGGTFSQLARREPYALVAVAVAGIFALAWIFGGRRNRRQR